MVDFGESDAAVSEDQRLANAIERRIEEIGRECHELIASKEGVDGVNFRVHVSASTESGLFLTGFARWLELARDTQPAERVTKKFDIGAGRVATVRKCRPMDLLYVLSVSQVPVLSSTHCTYVMMWLLRWGIVDVTPVGDHAQYRNGEFWGEDLINTLNARLIEELARYIMDNS